MDHEIVDNTAEIEAYCRRNPPLHLYELGDLDPFFAGRTRWFGARGAGGQIGALALLYRGNDVSTLLALCEANALQAELALLRTIEDQLPDTFYAHLSPGLEAALTGRRLVDHGRHLKMALTDRSKLAHLETPCIPLASEDLEELEDFYRASYPGNWFDPTMLATGQYLGLRHGGALACVAGVHVYSRQHRVAALGNITTAPAHRGRGLARAATATLCRQLLRTVDWIGLNVSADNQAAIACYRAIGFEAIAEYRELMAHRG